MRTERSSRTSLFLLELMISMIFFFLAAAGCVQIFVKAHCFSVEAEQLDVSVSIAQSLAEEYRIAGTMRHNDSEPEVQTLIRYYDAAGEACEKETAAYQALVQCDREHGMRYLTIDVAEADTEEHSLYHLETSVYQPDHTGGSYE